MPDCVTIQNNAAVPTNGNAIHMKTSVGSWTLILVIIYFIITLVPIYFFKKNTENTFCFSDIVRIFTFFIVWGTLVDVLLVFRL